MSRRKDKVKSKALAQPWILLTAILVAALVFSSCGEKEEAEPEISVYRDWAKYTYGHFIIYFSPSSRFSAEKAELARGYERFLTEICEMLEMPVPEDDIYLYVYANRGEAKKLTGMEAPFSNDTAIHWAGLRPYGYQLTKYLLAKKGVPEGRFTVLNEGLPHLFDFSGRNYHDRTNRLVNSNKFVGLSILGDNDAFDSLPSRTQSGESASLAAFIMFNYGLDRITMLNSSVTDWDESIEVLFQMDIDLFEKTWLDFAREYSDDPDGTIDNDPTQQLRIEIDEQ